LILATIFETVYVNVCTPRTLLTDRRQQHSGVRIRALATRPSDSASSLHPVHVGLRVRFRDDARETTQGPAPSTAPRSPTP
jgi:hypothetical protein